MYCFSESSQSCNIKSDLVNVAILLSSYSVNESIQPVFCAGIDECDGSNATDGLQTHQLCQSEDDDDAPHEPPIQRGLPSALLPVSTHTHTDTGHIETEYPWCIASVI